MELKTTIVFKTPTDIRFIRSTPDSDLATSIFKRPSHDISVSSIFVVSQGSRNAILNVFVYFPYHRCLRTSGLYRSFWYLPITLYAKVQKKTKTIILWTGFCCCFRFVIVDGGQSPPTTRAFGYYSGGMRD